MPETPTPTLSSSRPLAAGTRAGIVAALASRPADMTGRARYAIRTYAVGSVTHPLVTSLEGVADFDHQQYSARVVLFNPTVGSSTPPMEFFVVADQIHERLPQGWMTGTKRPSEIGSPVPLPPLLGYLHDGGMATYAGDPAARRMLVEGLVSGIEFLGSEVLRGTRTDRYRVQFDAPAASGKVPGRSTRERLGSSRPSRTRKLRGGVLLHADATGPPMGCQPRRRPPCCCRRRTA